MQTQSTAEDQYLLDSGYKPQLHRTLKPFASFAIAFSCMSILVGVFALYSFVLQTAGPFGIWTWPIVAIGQFLIALVFAEMASRVPLAGSIYNWNKKFGNPTLGWQAGWLIVFSYSTGAVAGIIALMTPLQSLLGVTFPDSEIKIIGVAIIVLQLLINIFGVRLAAGLNRIAVILEIATILCISVGLVIAGLVHHAFNPGLLTHIPTTPAPYWPALLMAGLFGVFTLIGFESSSDIAEETLDARTAAPKSIRRAVATSGILGFIFVAILTLLIPNLADVTASADPVSMIVGHYFGIVAVKALLTCVVIAIFAVTLLIITYVSRLAFAVARDGRVFGWKFLSNVSNRGIPVGACILVAVLEIGLWLFAYGQTAIFATNAILTALVYLITIFNFMRAQRSFGSWKPALVWAAILWLVFQVGVLTLPAEFHTAAYISIAIVVIGFVLQFIFGRPLQDSNQKTIS